MITRNNKHFKSCFTTLMDFNSVVESNHLNKEHVLFDKFVKFSSTTSFFHEEENGVSSRKNYSGTCLLEFDKG